MSILIGALPPHLWDRNRPHWALRLLGVTRPRRCRTCGQTMPENFGEFAVLVGAGCPGAPEVVPCAAPEGSCREVAA